MSPLDLPGGGRLYMRIAQKLADDIAAGRYRTGERLPPERDLAVSLQVSRTTVREALLALEIMRQIEIRTGAGVFVLPEAMREPVPARQVATGETGPWEQLEARRAIEGQVAYLAAERADEAQIAEMERLIDESEAALDDVPRFDAVDAEFHAAIARAAGNALLEEYVAHLWSMRGGPMWARWYDQTRTIQNRRRSVEDHRAILRAIIRQRPDAAMTAMKSHLDVLAERFHALNL
ncbi:FadR/GntR family transcriptional regulator [Psychromarinibacter halotolerans]|uniref:FadR/GntR family transcriptional regulator n=1 Tax=Psychromarinibacter halotolerans TaxID=1775175 RepID=A0ABV7GVE3_9RHOB|nr:FadR/GntR family transcriptional regulator [Psychromarinibacter halotolerans]MDF0595261.1 FadR/GntR family transcriptional regulator [Psychromarinibacter halotolerans]